MSDNKYWLIFWAMVFSAIVAIVGIIGYTHTLNNSRNIEALEKAEDKVEFRCANEQLNGDVNLTQLCLTHEMQKAMSHSKQ